MPLLCLKSTSFMVISININSLFCCSFSFRHNVSFASCSPVFFNLLCVLMYRCTFVSTRWRTRCNLRQNYITEADCMMMNSAILGSLLFTKNPALMHRLSQQHGKKCIMSVRVQPLGRTWLCNTPLPWASVLQGRFYGALLANISTIILFIHCAVPHLMREDILRSDQSCGPCYHDASTPHARSCRLNPPSHETRLIPSSFDTPKDACLPAHRWASTEETWSGRERRQPISGLVSLQHLGGSERGERSRAQAAGRRTARSVRDAQLWFCEEGYDRRWLTRNIISRIFIFFLSFRGVELTFLFHKIRWQHAWMTLFCM